MIFYQDTIISGSLDVKDGITGSLQGTSSFAVSASWAPQPTVTSTFPYTGSAVISGSLDITGSLSVSGSITGLINSASYALVAENFTSGSKIINGDLFVSGVLSTREFWVDSSSVVYTSGSTKWGNTLDDIHEFTGSVSITGSLVVSSSLEAERAVLNNLTGSLYGTASQAIFASSSLSASYAATASYAKNLIVSGGINPVSYIVFNSSSTAPLQDYMLQANTVDKTLDLRMGNNATLQLGQEVFFPPIVNKSGIDLLDGTLVMVNPAGIAQGNRISVVKAITDGTYAADKIVGVLTENVANNAEGFATWFGYVRDISKTHVQPIGEIWAEGDILYPSPTLPGGFTNVFPSAPNLRITVATVTAINGNNVTILVNFHKRTALKRAHDVADNTTTSSYGDLLMKSGSVWTNTKQLSGSYGLTGSLEVNGSITGSLFGTASYALNASSSLSASYASSSTSASYASSSTSASFASSSDSASYALFATSASFASASTSASYSAIAFSASFASSSTSASFALTASYLEGYVSPFPFTGSAVISGSLQVTGSLEVTGSITGSLFGTASYATAVGINFEQTASATTWTIDHNLNNRHPLVQVYDSAHKVIVPSAIEGTTLNQTTITFSSPRVGYVRVI